MTPISDIIRASGRTHQQIAEDSGLSVSLISKLATGKRSDVRVSTYVAIQRACSRAADEAQSKAA